MADLPAEQLEGPKGTSALQKLKDLWWRICTKEGKQLPVVDINGNPIPNRITSQDNEASWNPENFRKLNEKLDKITTKLGA
jgi:hypothetical protein